MCSAYPRDALHPRVAFRASEDINREDFQQHRRPGKPSPPDGLARGDLLVSDAVAAWIGFLDFRRFRDDQLSEFRVGGAVTGVAQGATLFRPLQQGLWNIQQQGLRFGIAIQAADQFRRS